MADLTALANHLNTKKCVCRAIIEIPRGFRNKFGLLPEGMMFPYDFGLTPGTLGEDGDPMDILVLMDAPAHLGCLIDVRIIGIVEAKQTEHGSTGSNDRLLGVAIHSYLMTQIAADALGVPVTQVTFRLGDTRYPQTPVSGGSMTAATTGSAVFEAATALNEE